MTKAHQKFPLGRENASLKAFRNKYRTRLAEFSFIDTK